MQQSEVKATKDLGVGDKQSKPIKHELGQPALQDAADDVFCDKDTRTRACFVRQISGL
jgi:hypothetical protein